MPNPPEMPNPPRESGHFGTAEIPGPSVFPIALPPGVRPIIGRAAFAVPASLRDARGPKPNAQVYQFSSPERYGFH
jgi:hypothetical protein